MDEKKGISLDDWRAFVDDHARLFFFELHHEKRLARRRLLAVGVGVFFFALAGFLGHVALLSFFVDHGYQLSHVAFWLGLVDFVGGLFAMVFYARRRNDEGKPFEASLDEFAKTRQWIENTIFKPETRSEPE